MLHDGDHFLGRFTTRNIGRDDPAQREAIRQMTLAFLDAQLRGSKAARDWLGGIGGTVPGAPLLFKRK